MKDMKMYRIYLCITRHGVYCNTCFFRALLFLAIFAIWTPFAKNTRSRNIQFRRSSNYFQNRVLTGTSACTSTGNRSIHRPHKFSLILSIVWSVSCQFHRVLCFYAAHEVCVVCHIPPNPRVKVTHVHAHGSSVVVGAVELNKNYSGWTAQSIHGKTKF